MRSSVVAIDAAGRLRITNVPGATVAAGARGARQRDGATVALAHRFAWSLSQWNLLGWRL